MDLRRRLRIIAFRAMVRSPLELVVTRWYLLTEGVLLQLLAVDTGLKQHQFDSSNNIKFVLDNATTS